MGLKGKYPTNLTSHLQTKHPAEYADFIKEKETKVPEKKKKLNKQMQATKDVLPKIDKAFNELSRTQSIVKKGSPQHTEMIKSITVAFVTNALPYRLINDSCFRNMLKVVSSGRLVEQLSRQELSESIVDLTANVRAAVATSLGNAKYVSMAVDLWSRQGYRSAFIGVTCHFFDRMDGQLKRALLACRKIPQPHTAERIYAATGSILSEWECLIMLAKENCTPLYETLHARINNWEDYNLDQEEYNEDDDQQAIAKDVAEYDNHEIDADAYYQRQKRISCFAHDLMLAARKAVDSNDSVTRAKNRALSLIGVFGKSSKAKELLKEKTELGLVKPVLTRWIYWYYVFQRLLKLKKSVLDVCEELGIIHDLVPIDWKLIESVTEIMEPMATAVTRLEGEYYVTISEVYPTLYGLLTKLKRIEDRCTQARTVATVLIREIKFRFARVLISADLKFDPTYVLATYLDPRYGLMLEGDLLQAVVDELHRLARLSNNGIEEVAPVALGIDSVSDGSAGNDLLALARAKVSEKRRNSFASLGEPGKIDDELTIYMCDLKAPNPDSEKNLLLYWNMHKDTLPILYDVAVDLLSVPATSAPVERVFSRASLVLMKNRHNLSDAKLEKEIFFKFNMEFL